MNELLNNIHSVIGPMIVPLPLTGKYYLGGVVGINFAHDFIMGEGNTNYSTIKDIVAHINHIVDVIGIDYVGLGSDFDGISNEDIELKDASLMPKLLLELQEAGYSKEDIDKITHKNVLRVFKANF